MKVHWENAEAGSAAGTERIPERAEIDPGEKWDVEALYADDAAWEADFQKIDSLVAPIETMRGQLNSAEAIQRLFEAETALERLMAKVRVYAHLRADEDTANDESQGRESRVKSKMAEVAGRLAWILPEILAHDEETLRAWADAEILRPDRINMVRILRRKPHTLSDAEESLLSRAGEILTASSRTFTLLTNADFRFPTIVGGDGRERELSQGRYVTFLLDRDRRARRDAFNAMYDAYDGHRNALASTLSATVKLHNYMARTRRFPSALEASLHPDHIPVSLYEALIESTRRALAHFHEYVGLRKRQLGLEDLGMHDMYISVVPECEMKVSFDRAREWIMEACRPLGEEYVAVLGSAFGDRWIDVRENRGKRSGAYSSGCYDSLPYLLLNYQETVDSVFTLAHELGHSVHTFLANQSQPPRTAEYPIFIAEIPSTVNEGLLLRHLLRTAEDPALRAYLLNHLCDSYKGTVYRQTMFAEFEKTIHEMDGDGKPLTPDALREIYFKMNADYYGPEVQYDERIGLEWSRIPHFYYNFYVYKYATSFCASRIFLDRILAGGPQRDRYLDMLRAGGSGDPLDLIEAAGVSLTSRETLEKAFEEFGRTVSELGEALQAIS
jgi:oligoendopeptidase F